MQREIPTLCETQKPKNAPVELVKMCDDPVDAMRLCIQLSRFTSDYVGKQLSIDKGQLSRIMSGTAWFPTTKRVRLMELCGNRAPVQFEADAVGCVLVEKAEFEKMQSELKELRRIAKSVAQANRRAA